MERRAAGFWSGPGPQSSNSRQARTRSRTSCKPPPLPLLTFLQHRGLARGHGLPAVPWASASLHGSPAPLCRPALPADSSLRPLPAKAGSERAVPAAPVGPDRPGRWQSPRHSQAAAREPDTQPTTRPQPEPGVKSRRRLPESAAAYRAPPRAEKLRPQGLPHAKCCSRAKGDAPK